MKLTIPVLLTIVLLGGCKAQIGDSCTYDQDCSADGDRTCDNTQSGGYCLIITCTPDECPDNAACTEFITPAPGMDTDSDTGAADLYSYLASSRTRTYCLEKCSNNKDCRDKYHCAKTEELESDLNAAIIDPDNNKKGVCVPDQTD